MALRSAPPHNGHRSSGPDFVVTTTSDISVVDRGSVSIALTEVGVAVRERHDDRDRGGADRSGDRDWDAAASDGCECPHRGEQGQHGCEYENRADECAGRGEVAVGSCG